MSKAIFYWSLPTNIRRVSSLFTDKGPLKLYSNRLSLAPVSSIQIIDGFATVTVFLLSIYLLGYVYTKLHYFSAFSCASGLALLIYLGSQNLTTTTLPPNQFLGDMLAVIGALLYGVSNVMQELILHR